MLQNLPVGIQSFADLRSNNYLYVDKTEHIYRMIVTGKPYFLSRPRRFGKSLLVSTMEAVFQGRKELFEGLYIYDKWDWSRKYPVIRLDFGGMSYDTPDMLKTSLSDFVIDTAFTHDILLRKTETADRFGELIKKLHNLYNQQVVVLIDEYDKPIIDNLKELEVANNIRKVLHNFYQVLKSVDEHLRFIFLTGVSKFSKVSIFSGLNNLDDLTIHPQYSTICGYTQQELETNFDSYIEALAKYRNVSKQTAVDEIKCWYDGYSWDGKISVYNPFSTLQLFKKNQFIDYWFASGTPTFLVDLIRKRNDVKDVTQPFEMSASGFDAFEITTLNTRLLLFQTGYLTIKKEVEDPFSPMPQYLLDIPNEEVRRGLMTHLLADFSQYSIVETPIMKNRMMKQLFNGDATALENSLREMFARIPYQLHVPREAYWHSLLLLWLNLLGFKVDAEIQTNTGRIDAVWTWEERVVVAEVKYAVKESLDALLDDAMNQIRERRYWERYGNDKRIALLAVAFANREIGCRMEELNG